MLSFRNPLQPFLALLLPLLSAVGGVSSTLGCSPGTVASAGGRCVESAAFIVGGQGANFQWSGTTEIYGDLLGAPEEVADFPTSMDTPVMAW